MSRPQRSQQWRRRANEYDATGSPPAGQPGAPGVRLPGWLLPVIATAVLTWVGASIYQWPQLTAKVQEHTSWIENHNAHSVKLEDYQKTVEEMRQNARDGEAKYVRKEEWAAQQLANQREMDKINVTLTEISRKLDEIRKR